ncbi:hypothetical protein WISP_24052 [Willisornis vidua]|uniref:Cingulin n=1 Tax=Willisornis vidua TaxID=1566151 RepID=A0ABQ9DMF1_9PASS|nr:hypothetical protein WISP_24052 [Willisornis vidua]
MERPAGMEKQSPVDYGVQIRFINDLQEPRKAPKPRGKPGSYGVAVRVQGIAGQPFVVLNSGDKGGDSFGVQIKSEGSYPTPPRLSGSLSSDSDLPENPYAGRQRRHGSYSTSDEEAPGGSRRAPQAAPHGRVAGEELRRTQSHGDLLGATAVEVPVAGGIPGIPQPRALSGGKSSSMLSIGPEGRARGARVGGKDPSSDTEVAAGDVDTKPLSSVDSLISKFDGKGQQRGRAARRGRVPSAERKRSQSLDGRVSQRDGPDTRGTPTQPAGTAPRGPPGMEGGGTRSQLGIGAAEEQSKARAELQLKSTPDLLRDQRELAQPGGSEHPKELIYNILKEGLKEVRSSKEQVETRLGHCEEQLLATRRELERLHHSPRAAQDAQALYKELLEAREELEEALEARQRQEEQLRLRERELTALKGALKEEVATHDQELERVRQQCQSELEQLRRSMEGISQLKEYERLGDTWEGSQARLKDKVTKLEAERRNAEEALGEATEREQELLLAKRSLETRLEEAERSLARLAQEHQDLSVSYQEEQRQKEQLKRSKNELEEQKRLLDRTTEKLNRELEQMTAESQSSLTALRSQLEEFKEKSRRELTDSQKQAKDRGAEVEKMQFSLGRLQDEVSRLKQALQDSQAERDNVLLDKEVLLQRLHNVEQEMESRRRSQDDRSRHAKALEEKSKRLEVELEEERSTVELLTERVNRSRDQRTVAQYQEEVEQTSSALRRAQRDVEQKELQVEELQTLLGGLEEVPAPPGGRDWQCQAWEPAGLSFPTSKRLTGPKPLPLIRVVET